MNGRIEIELTDAEWGRLMDACRPVPYIIGGGVAPSSQQENANACWRALGAERGFAWDTVQKVPGKSQRWISVVPREDPE
jgi:hypothetical protein